MPPVQRIQAVGPQLVAPNGERIVLSGVNMYLEWYVRYHETAVYDVKNLRTAIPAANVVRLVALLWQDSHGGSDGMECSTDDADEGYLSRHCMNFITAAVKQITDAGLWVIITARAKYAAGYTWPDDPDVFHNHQLREKYLHMWRHVSRRFAGMDRIAGYEIMSEPRTRTVNQHEVMTFMGEGCDAVHEADPRALCIVGPAPYYKIWNLADMQAMQALGDRTQIVYTFNFFVPKVFVMSDSADDIEEGETPNSFPGLYNCREVFETWWRGHCDGRDDDYQVDETFVREAMRDFAVRLRDSRNAPVYCNQWGVKDEVGIDQGRLRYANALLDEFVNEGISSTYWIWRSYAKSGRDVREPEWGFELVHNPGHDEVTGDLLPEMVEIEMSQALQAAFIRTNRHPAPPCIDDWSNLQQSSETCRFTAGLYPPPPPIPEAPQPPLVPLDEACHRAKTLQNARELNPPRWCGEILARDFNGCNHWFTTEGIYTWLCLPPRGSLGMCRAGPQLVCIRPPPALPPPPFAATPAAAPAGMLAATPLRLGLQPAPPLSPPKLPFLHIPSPPDAWYEEELATIQAHPWEFASSVLVFFGALLAMVCACRQLSRLRERGRAPAYNLRGGKQRPKRGPRKHQVGVADRAMRLPARPARSSRSTSRSARGDFACLPSGLE